MTETSGSESNPEYDMAAGSMGVKGLDSAEDEDWLMLKPSFDDDAVTTESKITTEEMEFSLEFSLGDGLETHGHKNPEIKDTCNVDAAKQIGSNVVLGRNFSDSTTEANVVDLYYTVKKNLLSVSILFLVAVLTSDGFCAKQDIDLSVAPSTDPKEKVLVKQLQQKTDELAVLHSMYEEDLETLNDMYAAEFESLNSMYANHLSAVHTKKKEWQFLAGRCDQERRDLGRAFDELEESVRNSKLLVPIIPPRSTPEDEIAPLQSYNSTDVAGEPVLSIGRPYSALVVAACSTALSAASSCSIPAQRDPFEAYGLPGETVASVGTAYSGLVVAGSTALAAV
jgi:hypothetical protein